MFQKLRRTFLLSASLFTVANVVSAVPASKIAFCAEAAETYHVGDQVEVQWPGDNKWYAAKVTEVKDGKYFIIYDADGLNAWYTPDRMRLVKAAEPAPKPEDKTPVKPAPAPKAEETRETPAQKLRFKPGDRVEVDKAKINSWEKGTVMPFLKGDPTTGEVYRVRLDAQTLYPEGILIFDGYIRLLAGAKPAVLAPKVIVDKDNTVLPDRPLLSCPVKQPRVKNGAKPNPELIKKLIRCRKGEKPSTKGADGAVTVDVTELKIAAPRRWTQLEDEGTGTVNTLVYEVRATYTIKTWNRTNVVIEKNWVRILNFYVDSFGEWRVGAETPVKSPEIIHLTRQL